MMNDKTKSTLEKLKNKSKSTGVDYQLLLQLLCQEEFLRRLSMSDYNNNFILKGGLFIYLLSDFKSRVTVDMDFLLRNLSNDTMEIIECVKSILSTGSKYDFIDYEVLNVKQITLEKKYPGISIQMIGKIGNTKTPVNIDFGIGDVVVPKPETRIMRAQLSEFDDIKVKTYSLESTISEKFDAILQRFELTSRMKDFYDIWYLAVNYDFDGTVLSSAVKDTLNDRGTIFEVDSLDRVVRLAENQTIMIRWHAFCLKMNIDLELSECIDVLKELLIPIVNSLLVGDMYTGIWVLKEVKWVEKSIKQ